MKHLDTNRGVLLYLLESEGQIGLGHGCPKRSFTGVHRRRCVHIYHVDVCKEAFLLTKQISDDNVSITIQSGFLKVSDRRRYYMKLLPFRFKKMRWIYVFIAVNIILFAMSKGNAASWKELVFSSVPFSLVLTSFLHFGFSHLLSNMYAAFVFGGLLCTNMSDRKANGLTLPILFVVASVVTGIVPFFLQPNAYTAGASGTVYALEAYVFVMAFAGGSDPLAVSLRRQSKWLIINAVIAVIWSFNTNVSIIGHFSGAFVGAIIAWIDLQRRKQIKKYNDNQRLLDL